MGQLKIIDEDYLYQLNNWAIIGKSLVRRIDHAAADIYGTVYPWEGPTVAGVANEQLSLIIADAKKQRQPWYRRFIDGLL